MSRSFARTAAPRFWRSLAAALTGAAFAAAALAAPFFSGPSVVKGKQAAQFSGKGFAPGSAVTVMVKSPSGNAAGYGAVATAQGEFQYTLQPTEQGAYTVTVTDSGGRPLASATVAVLP